MKKGSKAPISSPFSNAPAQAPSKKYQGPRTPTSNRKQLRNAKKNPKRPISVRGLITGLFILIATSIAVTAVTSPDILSKVAAGEIVQRTEICVVTEINSSNYFDSSCGKFQWNPDRQPGTPKTKLVEGDTYTIKSSGLRFGMAKMFPSVVAYEKGSHK
jgi:hypothetical protein